MLTPVLFGDVLNNVSVILAQTIMVERGRQMFGASTIALIDADTIPSFRPGFVCQANHVMGFGAAFQSMNKQNCRFVAWGGLPVTFGE